MAQHDYNISNATFPSTRSDINDALSAVASNNSGTTAPSTTFSNQWFYETDTNLLQIRNEDNDAYITIAELDQTNDTVEYFKADSIRTALIEFTDGDDAITIADGGGITISTSLDMNGTELILDADADSSITADTDDQIDFKTGGTDRLTIQSTSGNNVVVADGLTLTDGNITFSGSGHGIHLGVTSATASNLLDDYEEGTFTPSYTSTGATFTAFTSFGLSTGHYTKIGNVVYCRIQVSTNGASGGTASNNVEIQGLPFTVTNATNKNYASSAIVSFDWAGDHPYGGLADANTTKVNLYHRDASDGTGANRINYGDIQTASGPVNSVYLTVWYHVD